MNLRLTSNRYDCKKWCLFAALLEAMAICMVVGITLYVASLWIPS